MYCKDTPSIKKILPGKTCCSSSTAHSVSNLVEKTSRTLKTHKTKKEMLAFTTIHLFLIWRSDCIIFVHFVRRLQELAAIGTRSAGFIQNAWKVTKETWQDKQG